MTVSVGEDVTVGVSVGVPVIASGVDVASGKASVAVDAKVGLGVGVKEESGASITASPPRQ